MKTSQRTHTCGELRKEQCGERVTLCGWAHRTRDHGGLLFIDLRDRWGLTQVVFNPEVAPEAHGNAESVRNEYVITVTGTISLRPPETANPKLATGEIEVLAEKIEVCAPAQTPPFIIEDETDAGEEIRLRHRYLDLRRPALQHAMELRHRLVFETRKYFDSGGFLEIETPVLSKSTPEGARDYLVPSRTQPGTFFALPQSPQLMKQLLMVSGIDRYFQICKCFRDEDLRADRQPEFSQIDLEMSFVGQEDIFTVIEGLVSHIFGEVSGIDIPVPFPRMTHAEALARYGSDKPDLRFGLELREVTELVSGSDFKVFKTVCESGGGVKGMTVPGGAAYSRSALDGLTKFTGDYGAKGLAWFKMKEGKLESPIAKFFTPGQLMRLAEEMGVEEGGLILFVADRMPVANAALAALRERLGRELELAKGNGYLFSWIIDFPLFTYNEEEGRYESEHHPFTSPRPEDIHLLEEEPLKVRSSSYDLVLNGRELGSGSVRIHDPRLQKRIFSLLKLEEDVIQERFGFFLEALGYGTPPHAGIALGLDRLVMIMAGRGSLRDVIAFPKTQKASCLMTGSPAPVSPEQLRDLHIRIKA